MTVEWIIAALLFAIMILLLEGRITVGTKIAVMANDMEWFRASLAKWGMIPLPRRDDRGD